MSANKGLRRLLRDLTTPAVLFALLAALYFLPPDTSLAELEKGGVLRVCVPDAYPPLITGDPAKPGFDAEMLAEIAKRMNVRLDLNRIAAMGKDFNPRNWRVTRTLCHMLAGGTVDSTRTRSFLDVSQPYLHTGWALYSPNENQALKDARLGFYPGLTGLDRIALSRYLKAEGANARIDQSMESIAARITAGELDGGIGEVLSVTALADAKGWHVTELPLERYPIVLGLWRGDLTLKRRIEAIIAEMKSDGTMQAIADKYGLEAVLE